MKSLLPLVLLLALLPPLKAQDKAALHAISEAYETTEKNSELWPHRSCSGENLEDGHDFEYDVWQSDDDSHLMKVESHHYDEHGELMTQLLFKEGNLLFALDHTELRRAEPKAPTEVTEKRYYFSEAGLLGLLVKEGKFPDGKPVDTSDIEDKSVPLSEVPDAGERYANYEKTAKEIIAKLARLDEEDQPEDGGAEAKTGGGPRVKGKGWRLIKGTRSPDDKFALGWGLKGQAEAKGDAEDDGTLSVDADSPGLANYVVNLETGAIAGSTGAFHFGDKPNYNQNTCEAVWSRDAGFVAQVCNGKWETGNAQVFQLRDDGTLSPGADIIKAATKAAFEQIAGSPQLKKFTKKQFAISLHDLRIAHQGSALVLQTELTGQVPKNDDEDSIFDCTVTFKLAEGENAGAPVLTWSSTERQSNN